MQLFSRALNISEAQLFKQMEQGKLIATEVLPKVAAEFKRAALEGGAYALALKGLRVTEGKFLTESQRAGDKIFKSGFSAGLAELYETLGETLKDSGPQLEKIGKIFGKVFSGLAHLFRTVEPLFKIFIDNIELAFGVVAIRTMSTFATAANLSLARAFLPLTFALAAAEELMSLMNDKVVGTIERTMGRQVNITTGETSAITERGGKLFKGKVDPTSVAGSFVKGANFQDIMKQGIIPALSTQAASILQKSLSSSPASAQSVNNTTEVKIDITGVPNQGIAAEIRNEMNILFSGGMAGATG